MEFNKLVAKFPKLLHLVRARIPENKLTPMIPSIHVLRIFYYLFEESPKNDELLQQIFFNLDLFELYLSTSFDRLRFFCIALSLAINSLHNLFDKREVKIF